MINELLPLGLLVLLLIAAWKYSFSTVKVYGVFAGFMLLMLKFVGDSSSLTV